MERSYPGCRDLIIRALRVGGVPETSLDICAASITNSTLRQYNVGLKLWWQFCSDRHMDVFNATVPLLLEFLTFQFNRGASYGSLNSYRSAISQIVTPDIAQDFRVKRFFKGVYSLRPSSAKYNLTWDPEIVLKFIRELPESMILEDLTLKLAVLLALATGQRVQTLASIELHNIIKNSNGIIIKVSKRLKTSGPNKLQPVLQLPYFHQDNKICVATTLIEYLEKTKHLRNQSTNNLFITHKKPHHNASVQTIGRWIKTMLSKSGVDTSIFSPHSTRHASTSSAAAKGVCLDTIRIAAGWTEKSKTFANFYQRPIIKDCNFAKTVLNSK